MYKTFQSQPPIQSCSYFRGSFAWTLTLRNYEAWGNDVLGAIVGSRRPKAQASAKSLDLAKRVEPMDDPPEAQELGQGRPGMGNTCTTVNPKNNV